MADLNDLKKDFNNIRERMKERLPDIAVLMTITAKSLAERKIRDAGFMAVYSAATVPAYLLSGKEKSQRGKSYIDKAIKDETEINWSGLRAAEGLQNQHVDLGFTNKMWAGMGPLQPYWDGEIIRAPLGGNNEEVIDKMNWNRSRYGDFLGKVITSREFDLLADVVREEIEKVLAEFGIKPQ